MKNLYDYFIEMLNYNDDKLVLLEELAVNTDKGNHWKEFLMRREQIKDIAEYLEYLSGYVEKNSYDMIVYIHKSILQAIYGNKTEEILLYIRKYKALIKIKKLENKINHLTKILNETKKKYGIK